MFKVGDYVRFKDEYSFENWYTSEVYCIKEIKIEPSINIILVLDRQFPTVEPQYDFFYSYYMILDKKTNRLKKLKAIFDD